MTNTTNKITADLGCLTTSNLTTTICGDSAVTICGTSITPNTISLTYPNPPTLQTYVNNFCNKITLDFKNNNTITKTTEQCKEASKTGFTNLWVYDTTLKIKVPYIENVKILCPNKVLQFTFSDKTVIKTICLDSDQFDFEFAFYLAYAKYLWQKILTPAGVERKAREYTETKFFVKLVNTAFKTINKKQKEEEKLAKEKKEKKAIAERRATKKATKAKKQREARIMETVEAIKRAKQ